MIKSRSFRPIGKFINLSALFGSEVYLETIYVLGFCFQYKLINDLAAKYRAIVRYL